MTSASEAPWCLTARVNALCLLYLSSGHATSCQPADSTFFKYAPRKRRSGVPPRTTRPRRAPLRSRHCARTAPPHLRRISPSPMARLRSEPCGPGSASSRSRARRTTEWASRRIWSRLKSSIGFAYAKRMSNLILAARPDVGQQGAAATAAFRLALIVRRPPRAPPPSKQHASSAALVDRSTDTAGRV